VQGLHHMDLAARRDSMIVEGLWPWSLTIRDVSATGSAPYQLTTMSLAGADMGP
jgi:hypothetical protein